MFAHIGEDYVINSSELLVILNWDSFILSEDNRKILENLKLQDRIFVINDEIKKSIIILEIDGRMYGIISPVSPGTIAKRLLNFNLYIDNYLDQD
ncbi:hypothetical protein COB47_0006 [Caldicellulosiruptor obsidiansis OB47]|uniref:DUF370 domain-containing protein n=1 Tax=Caldicellulosiruptor obsidiansis (strain ATCC BAA-2073 / JCM 16842 / OB47) TaxID=608506 RepID=D9TGQ0_CALOO|nr:extracellular matrix/biofilm biosynthesis regulator RemA family protein [Caldicellulosiruptor obsidiansis]ADL41386.1 hypothetical protein COB47_0006 [Caldicellulosiruptor obsidiansis OB47]